MEQESRDKEKNDNVVEIEDDDIDLDNNNNGAVENENIDLPMGDQDDEKDKSVLNEKESSNGGSRYPVRRDPNGNAVLSSDECEEEEHSSDAQDADNNDDENDGDGNDGSVLSHHVTTLSEDERITEQAARNDENSIDSTQLSEEAQNQIAAIKSGHARVVSSPQQGGITRVGLEFHKTGRKDNHGGRRERYYNSQREKSSNKENDDNNVSMDSHGGSVASSKSFVRDKVAKIRSFQHATFDSHKLHKPLLYKAGILDRTESRTQSVDIIHDLSNFGRKIDIDSLKAFHATINAPGLGKTTTVLAANFVEEEEASRKQEGSGKENSIHARRHRKSKGAEKRKQSKRRKKKNKKEKNSSACKDQNNNNENNNNHSEESVNSRTEDNDIEMDNHHDSSNVVANGQSEASNAEEGEILSHDPAPAVESKEAKVDDLGIRKSNLPKAPRSQSEVIAFHSIEGCPYYFYSDVDGLIHHYTHIKNRPALPSQVQVMKIVDDPKSKEPRIERFLASNHYIPLVLDAPGLSQDGQAIDSLWKRQVFPHLRVIGSDLAYQRILFFNVSKVRALNYVSKAFNSYQSAPAFKLVTRENEDGTIVRSSEIDSRYPTTTSFLAGIVPTEIRDEFDNTYYERVAHYQRVLGAFDELTTLKQENTSRNVPLIVTDNIRSSFVSADGNDQFRKLHKVIHYFLYLLRLIHKERHSDYAGKDLNHSFADIIRMASVEPDPVFMSHPEGFYRTLIAAVYLAFEEKLANIFNDEENVSLLPNNGIYMNGRDFYDQQPAMAYEALGVILDAEAPDKDDFTKRFSNIVLRSFATYYRSWQGDDAPHIKDGAPQWVSDLLRTDPRARNPFVPTDDYNNRPTAYKLKHYCESWSKLDRFIRALFKTAANHAPPKYGKISTFQEALYFRFHVALEEWKKIKASIHARQLAEEEKEDNGKDKPTSASQTIRNSQNNSISPINGSNDRMDDDHHTNDNSVQSSVRPDFSSPSTDPFLDRNGNPLSSNVLRIPKHNKTRSSSQAGFTETSPHRRQRIDSTNDNSTNDTPHRPHRSNIDSTVVSNDNSNRENDNSISKSRVNGSNDRSCMQGGNFSYYDTSSSTSFIDLTPNYDKSNHRTINLLPNEVPLDSSLLRGPDSQIDIDPGTCIPPSLSNTLHSSFDDTFGNIIRYEANNNSYFPQSTNMSKTHASYLKRNEKFDDPIRKAACGFQQSLYKSSTASSRGIVATVMLDYLRHQRSIHASGRDHKEPLLPFQPDRLANDIIPATPILYAPTSVTNLQPFKSLAEATNAVRALGSEQAITMGRVAATVKKSIDRHMHHIPSNASEMYLENAMDMVRHEKTVIEAYQAEREHSSCYFTRRSEYDNEITKLRREKDEMERKVDQLDRYRRERDEAKRDARRAERARADAEQERDTAQAQLREVQAQLRQIQGIFGTSSDNNNSNHGNNNNNNNSSASHGTGAGRSYYGMGRNDDARRNDDRRYGYTRNSRDRSRDNSHHRHGHHH